MSRSSWNAVSSDQPAQVSCPQCGTPVLWTASSTYRPFCSRRCRLVDLGEWLDEGHRIPGEPADPPPPGDNDPH
ncbi:DNA gyrase inhibitor YacG [Spiribacter sp. 218]